MLWVPLGSQLDGSAATAIAKPSNVDVVSNFMTYGAMSNCWGVSTCSTSIADEEVGESGQLIN